MPAGALLRAARIDIGEGEMKVLPDRQQREKPAEHIFESRSPRNGFHLHGMQPEEERTAGGGPVGGSQAFAAKDQPEDHIDGQRGHGMHEDAGGMKVSGIKAHAVAGGALGFGDARDEAPDAVGDGNIDVAVGVAPEPERIFPGRRIEAIVAENRVSIVISGEVMSDAVAKGEEHGDEDERGEKPGAPSAWARRIGLSCIQPAHIGRKVRGGRCSRRPMQNYGLCMGKGAQARTFARVAGTQRVYRPWAGASESGNRMTRARARACMHVIRAGKRWR